jgi:LacI family gluconate utilization system Gnt-I transcriptional repressor
MGTLIAEKGYKNIGFVGTKMETDFRAGKRFRGFERAVSNADLSVADKELYVGNSTLRIGKYLTKALLERSPKLDCIYYSSDVLAAGGLMHCIENDISVPEKLGLAGFNGLDFREGLPALTATTYAFRKEIGTKAAQMIVEAHKSDQKRSHKMVTFEPKIEIGDTL